MAKPNVSDHVVRLQTDFKDFVRDAKRAGEKSGDLIAKSIEQGVKHRFVNGFMKEVRTADKKRREIEKRFHVYSETLDAKRTGKVTQQLSENAKELAKLNAELSKRNIDRETKERKEAERDVYREKLRLLEKLHDESIGEDALVESLKKAHAEMDSLVADQARAARSMDRATEKMTRGSQRAADFMKRFRRDATKGADDFAESLQGSLSGLQGKLTGSLDLGSMVSGGAGALGKGAGGLSEILGGVGAGGGAFASLAKGASGLLMVLGPLTVALGMFASLMFEMDKGIKEFNKGAVNTFGTRGVMNLGMKTLDENLRVLRHSTQDLTASLGLTEQEALGVFDAFDAGGVTFRRLTGGVEDATKAQQRLQSTLRATASTAKALGVGVNEFTGTLTEYMDTLAFSLEDVTGQFAMVSKQAQEAGFSTRRFYSLIVQATSGQASLNTRLDQTAELLVRMSKVLGEKGAAEALGGAAGSFKDMGTSDRYRMMMTTGTGRTKETIARSAQTQAANFLTRDDLDKGALLSAMKDSGVNLSGGALSDSKTLVSELASMTRTDQAKLIAAITSSSDKTIQSQGRALSQLVTVTRGTSGSMADMSDALSALDPGATIAMKLQSAMAVLGRPIHELTGVQRMAAEQITGMSGAQFEQYQAMAAQAEGSFGILTSIRDSGVDASDRESELLERFGAKIEDGKIIAENGQEVTSSMDLLTSLAERDQVKVADVMDENLGLAYESFDATVTIADILENKILFYLRGLYEDIGQPMLMWIQKTLGLGGSSDARQASISARAALRNEIETQQGRASSASKTVSSLEVAERRGSLTDEQKTALEEARRVQAEAQAVVSAGTLELRKQSSGDFSSLTGTKQVRVEGRRIGGMAAARSGLDSAGAGPTMRSESYTLSPEELLKQVRSRAGASVASSHAITGGSGATPTATSKAAAETTAEVTDAMVASGDTVAETTREESVETRKTLEVEGKDTRDHLTKVLTRETKLGNALARSDLPDAIVAAQMKQQLMSLGYAAGLDQTEVTEAIDTYFSEGKLSSKLHAGLQSQGGFEDGSPLSGMMSSLGIMPGARGAGRHGLDRHRSIVEEEGVEDFIYRGDGIRGSITPIDSGDEFFGAKRGGPIDRATGGGGNVVNISIHGDEGRIFSVVKRVLQTSGIGPGRVSSRA